MAEHLYRAPAGFIHLDPWKERALAVFETMLTARAMDEKMGKLVRQNKGGSFQLSISGHEMIGAISGGSAVHCQPSYAPSWHWVTPGDFGAAVKLWRPSGLPLSRLDVFRLMNCAIPHGREAS